MVLTVALLGAESTGKTTLAADLARVLTAEGRRVTVVPEYLREFCEAQGRTPRPEEQVGIATEQGRRITAAAAEGPDLVIADTTALMIAVYSDLLFDDPGLYPLAFGAHRGYGLTLLTALDVPWQADGLQRDGPHVRAPVNTKVRAALARGGIAYAVVSGTGEARVESALTAVRHALRSPAAAHEARANPRWTWSCDRCSDGDCERHLRLPR